MPKKKRGYGGYDLLDPESPDETPEDRSEEPIDPKEALEDRADSDAVARRAFTQLDFSGVSDLAKLNGKDRQVLIGLSKRAEGHTWRVSGEACGMSADALQHAATRRGWHTLQPDAKRELLHGLAVDTAIEATAQVNDHVRNQRYDRNTLLTAAGIFTDKAVNLRRVELQAEQSKAGPSDLASSILDRLAQAGGGQLSVTVSADTPRTVDVDQEEQS